LFIVLGALGGFIDAFGCELLGVGKLYNFCLDKFDGFLFPWITCGTFQIPRRADFIPFVFTT
jgi:hypothetical protein